jgi:hypothetical protein
MFVSFLVLYEDILCLDLLQNECSSHVASTQGDKSLFFFFNVIRML